MRLVTLELHGQKGLFGFHLSEIQCFLEVADGGLVAATLRLELAEHGMDEVVGIQRLAVTDSS